MIGLILTTWIALVNPDGTIAQFSTSDSTFVATNGQQTVALDNAQQWFVHQCWPNCIWSNSSLYVARVFTNSVVNQARPPLVVEEETFILNAASVVGITNGESPSLMLSNWTAAIQSATNTAQAISLVRAEAKFWTFFTQLGLQVSGASTTNLIIQSPVWDQIP